MNVKQVNQALIKGNIGDPRVLPHLTALREAPFVFDFHFGLDELPTLPGILMIRGPRQYGKSTWLEQQIRATVMEYGPGSAFYLNGDEIADCDELALRVGELVGLFDPRRKVKRLFIDEITSVRDWERALKRLADGRETVDVLIVTTGSKAIDLRRGAERLPGRKGRLDRTNWYFTPISFSAFRKTCSNAIQGDPLLAYIPTGGSPVACSEIAETGMIPEYVIEMTRDWINGECSASGRSRASLLAVFEALHRFGGSQLGQAKLAREAGLANNTVAAGYIGMLSDLMCIAEGSAWDESKKRAIVRRPSKYHFTNLLAAAAWGGDGLRSSEDYENLPPQSQGKWLEWLTAQELRKVKSIRGSGFPELVPYWSGGGHEIDFVLEESVLLEVKRGSADPMEYSWFTSVHPAAHLIVVSADRFETRGVTGVTMEDFLLDAESIIGASRPRR
jgi:predicted AAA+ superfamily ATPase